VGRQLAVGDHLAPFHALTLEDVDVAPLGNQLLHLVPVVLGDDQPLLALGILAEADGAAGLRQQGLLLGLAGLEKVRHPRQTAGDVAGLGGLLRDTGQDVADAHLGPVLHADDGARGQEVAGGRSVPRILTSKPFSSSSLTMGRRSLPVAGRCLGSRTSREVRPVTSSTLDWTVMPSIKSSKARVPATSVTTGWVCGSQLAATWPPTTTAPSLTRTVAP